jgi:hypothetical protein
MVVAEARTKRKKKLGTLKTGELLLSIYEH